MDRVSLDRNESTSGLLLKNHVNIYCSRSISPTKNGRKINGRQSLWLGHDFWEVAVRKSNTVFRKDMFIPKKGNKRFLHWLTAKLTVAVTTLCSDTGVWHNFSTAPDFNVLSKHASTTSSWTQQKCKSNSLCENVPTNIIARAWSNEVSLPSDADFWGKTPPLKLDITNLHVYISNVTCCPTRLLYHLKEGGSCLCFSQLGEVRFPSATPILISRLAGISHMVPRQFGGRLSRPMMS